MRQHVNIEKLKPGPNPCRWDGAPAKVRDLANAIEASRWVAPLQVERVGESYLVHAGLRRLAALRLLQSEGRLWKAWEGVPVQVVTGGELINLAENMNRHAPHPLELCHAFGLLRAAGRTQSEIASLCSYSTSRVSRMLGLLDRLHPQVVEHYRSRDVSASELIAVGWLKPERQLSHIAKTMNPQRSPTRQRVRSAKTVRRELTRIQKIERSPAQRATVAALRWVLGERSEVDL